MLGQEEATIGEQSIAPTVPTYCPLVTNATKRERS
jgi:hypothetical protein